MSNNYIIASDLKAFYGEPTATTIAINTKTNELIFTDDAFIACSIFDNMYLIYDCSTDIVIHDLLKICDDVMVSKIINSTNYDFNGFTFDRASNKLAIKCSYCIIYDEYSDIAVVTLIQKRWLRSEVTESQVNSTLSEQIIREFII